MCVKESHYQQVSSIEFSSCGTFLVTGGEDARVMVWRTLDLINLLNEDRNIKPYYAITDNTLPVTSVLLSKAGVVNDLRLYTTSGDATLRVYDVVTKTLLSTFILSAPIESATLDPANRAVYVGLNTGEIRIIPLYKINANTSVLESVGGNKKIVTVEADPELKNTFVHHQQNQEAAVTQLKMSLDGSSIVSGDSIGRVFVSDIVTRQVLKTFVPCNGSISVLSVNTCPYETVNATDAARIKNDKKHRLIPALKRVLADSSTISHQLYLEIPDEINEDEEEEEDEDFQVWLSRKAQQELSFKNLSTINSSVKSLSTNAGSGLVNSKVTELQETLDTVSNAYSELRTKHEELLKEHAKYVAQ